MTIKPRLPIPPRMGADDWTIYLREAIKRETGQPWQVAAWEVKDWSNRLTMTVKGVDPFVMALSVDVMAMNWGYERTLSPQRALSHVRMLRWWYDWRLPRWFWRAVWFSRFARTAAEVEYYNEWLAQAESAINTGDGYGGKSRMTSMAKGKLREAENIIVSRGGPPEFKLDWMDLRREALSWR